MDIAASLLTGGKNARLYRRLVYDMQIAQDVSAFQQSQVLGSVFVIIATARPGNTLDKIQAVIDEELDKLRAAPADEREMARTMNQIEANFYQRDGARRRIRRQGRSTECVLHAHRACPTTSKKTCARYRALSAEDIRRRSPLSAEGQARRAFDRAGEIKQ